MLLTPSAVRSRRHSYHSQADSAGSIPVTRSTREKRCHVSRGEVASIRPIVSRFFTLMRIEFHLGDGQLWTFGRASLKRC